MADDEEFLREAEGIRLTKKETVLILNNNNAIISSTGFIDSSWKFNYRELSGTEGVLNKSYMGNQYVVSYIASAVTGWKYISLIPMEVFWGFTRYD